MRHSGRRMVFMFQFALLILAVNILPLKIGAELNGHLEPLGNQRLPEEVIHELSYVPHPEEFWNQFVKPHKPVVFRGAAKHSRAYNLWTEDYLITEYGHTILRLEARAENDRGIPVGVGGLLGRDSMEHFMRNYQTMNAYVISQIPEPMEKDISIPPCLRCGSFAKSIQEVHLFLSAKGGKTVIHRDPYSNIHCLFNGTKQWIIINPKYTDKIYQSDESTYEYGGFSNVNVDAVDLEMFPLIQEVKYGQITLNSGDCIFMPGGYWHQVRSWGYMNSAVSIWFSRLTAFTNEGCESASITFTPMNEVPILWRYSGLGNLTQGHMDIYLIQKLLIQWADSNGRIWLKTFVDYFFHSESTGARQEVLEEDAQERGKQLLLFLDSSNKGYVFKADIENMSIGQLKEMALIFDPSDVSNQEDFEYSHLDVDDVRDALESSVDQDGNFDEDVFTKTYTQVLGGTVQKASEIVQNLGMMKDEKMPVLQLLNNAPNVLEKFFTARVHDPTFEHLMFKFFQKNWKQHDEL